MSKRKESAKKGIYRIVVMYKMTTYMYMIQVNKGVK